MRDFKKLKDNSFEDFSINIGDTKISHNKTVCSYHSGVIYSYIKDTKSSSIDLNINVDISVIINVFEMLYYPPRIIDNIDLFILSDWIILFDYLDMEYMMKKYSKSIINRLVNHLYKNLNSHVEFNLQPLEIIKKCLHIKKVRNHIIKSTIKIYDNMNLIEYESVAERYLNYINYLGLTDSIDTVKVDMVLKNNYSKKFIKDNNLPNIPIYVMEYNSDERKFLMTGKLSYEGIKDLDPIDNIIVTKIAAEIKF